MRNNRLTDDLIYQSIRKGTVFFEAIEQTLKGKEIRMPNGLSFKDKEKIERTELRIKWWEDPSLMTYKTISLHPTDDLPEESIDLSGLKENDYYKNNDKSVFFGHYWLKADQPSLFRQNICCLDYSVANNGYLVAYRLDDERILDEQKFIYVKKTPKTS